MQVKNADISRKYVSLKSNLIQQLKGFHLRGQPSKSGKNSQSYSYFRKSSEIPYEMLIFADISKKGDQVMINIDIFC